MTNQSSICAKCKNNMCDSNNDTLNITERRLRWLILHIILKDNFIACLMRTCTSGKRSSNKLVFLHWTTDIYLTDQAFLLICNLPSQRSNSFYTTKLIFKSLNDTAVQAK